MIAQVRVPIYQGGAEYAGVRQAKQNRSKATFTIGDIERQVRQNVDSAWQATMSARAAMALYEQQVQAAQLAYEGFTGGPVNIRVLASIVQISESSHRFQCQAYIVKSPGDPTFEEVIKLQNVRSGPYQDLCDKIAKKLK